MQNQARRASLSLLLLALLPLKAQQAPQSATDTLQHALHLADLYNWADAAKDFAAAEEMFVAAGDQRNALFARLGKIRSSVEQRALPSTSAQLAAELENNPLLLNDKQLRMFCWIAKGDIDGEFDAKAMRQDWEQVQALARDLADMKWQYRSLAQLGVAAFFEGDLATARKNVGTALIAATKAGDAGAQIRYFTALGIGLRESHMYEEALPYFENALKIAASTPDTGYPFLTNEALLETLIGLERNEAAQRLADNILAHAKQQHRIQQQAIVLNLSAHIARVQKDNHKALSTIQEALLLSETGGFLRETADAQSLLSDIYQEQGDHQRAEQFGTLAAASTQASGDTWSVPSRLQALAELQISRGKYAEADSVYDRAEDFVDSLIGNYSSVLEKTAIIKASSDLFARHFSLVAEKFNNPAKAYSIVEQVRGRVATDLLMAGSFASNEAKRTEKTISELRLKLIGAHSTAEVRRIRDQIFLVEQSRWITPEISILKAQSRERVGIERVQRSLSPSAAILEYVVAEPHSYCLVISYRGSRIVTLTGRHRIEALVMAYLKAVKAKQSAHDEARHLYDALLAPIPTAVQKTDLVVVRDGMLHFVPFDGFMDPIGHYVAEAHMVVYAPSATSFYLLATQRSPRRVASRALLAVGGVPHNGGESKQASITRGYNPEGFIDLPASKDEVLAAEAAVHSPGDRLLLGLDATESAFKQSSLSRYRIIHLAVHGLPSMIDPNRAALVLLSDPPAGEDGFLQASEIVQLRLNAELVVLSACDTAVGPVEGEEGIATLARAFLLSGARTVISTLWSIDDTFSFYLMKQFYKHLTAQEPPAHALAAAKRDMLGKYGSKAVPYYWAGFSFEGAADGVISRKEGRQTSHVTEPTSAR